MDDDNWGTAYNGKTYSLGGELLSLSLVLLNHAYWFNQTLAQLPTPRWHHGVILGSHHNAPYEDRFHKPLYLIWIPLGKEITLLWGRGRSLSAYCFFVNRYFAFLTGIPVSVIPFLSPSTEVSN
jgi:hypothetical protein